MIAIVDYKAGNTASVQHALNRLGRESVITADPTIIQGAAKVILPGVGEAATAMCALHESGLDLIIPSLAQPVLGICLGLQLLCRSSEEGNTTCLGIFNADVMRFPFGYVVPHMGWNDLKALSGKLFEHIEPASNDVYFVHSYYAGLCNETIAMCDYVLPFSAALQKNNFYATQFHPEKSGVIGEQILKNFLAL